MIKVRVRMPVVTKTDFKHKQKLGKPEIMTFKSRAELNEYLNGILKGARVQILKPEEGSTTLINPMMQSICGVA